MGIVAAKTEKVRRDNEVLTNKLKDIETMVDKIKTYVLKMEG